MKYLFPALCLVASGWSYFNSWGSYFVDGHFPHPIRVETHGKCNTCCSCCCEKNKIAKIKILIFQFTNI